MGIQHDEYGRPLTCPACGAVLPVPNWVDAAVWQRPDMRRALASRDIAAVYKLLQRYGVSQRKIAALTGQLQSEISELIGGRHVVAYDVLVRIADGLGVPRGWMGLLHQDTDQP